MNSLLKGYDAWRLRRQQLSLARWAEERAKGQWRFVLRQVFFFALVATGIQDALDQFFRDGRHSLGYYLVVNAITGILVGYVGWSSREAKYQKGLKALRQKSFQTH